MADSVSQGEITDQAGSTEHLNGTVGTVATTLPAVSGNVIAELFIENMTSNRDLEISFDGGTTYKTVTRSAAYAFPLKGELRQVLLRAQSATADYEIVLSLEDY